MPNPTPNPLKLRHPFDHTYCPSCNNSRRICELCGKPFSGIIAPLAIDPLVSITMPMPECCKCPDSWAFGDSTIWCPLCIWTPPVPLSSAAACAQIYSEDPTLGDGPSAEETSAAAEQFKLPKNSYSGAPPVPGSNPPRRSLTHDRVSRYLYGRIQGLMDFIKGK